MLFGQTQSTNNYQAIHTNSKKPLAPACLGLALTFIAGVLMSGCVVHHDGYGHNPGPVAVEPHVAVAVPAPVTFTFTNHHRHTVREYYNHHPHHHGKKHKKHKWKNRGEYKGRGHLPPGLAKRDVLPPGIQMQAVPVDLVRQLPRAPRGTRYSYYDNRVLLIDVQTRVVLDLINISVSTGY